METAVVYELSRIVSEVGSNMFYIQDLTDDEDTIVVVADYTEFSYYEEY